jgi:hypothetical protein
MLLVGGKGLANAGLLLHGQFKAWGKLASITIPPPPRRAQSITHPPSTYRGSRLNATILEFDISFTTT